MDDGSKTVRYGVVLVTAGTREEGEAIAHNFSRSKTRRLCQFVAD